MKLYRALLMILLASGIARADYHYASHEGSNEYPYTSWETAAWLIGDAVVAADPGDTVYIGPGEYYERVNMARADSSLALIGAGTDSTYWWWDQFGYAVLWCANNTTVERIQFEHTQWNYGVNNGWAEYFEVRDCFFANNFHGIGTHGASYLIEDCVFENMEGAVIGGPGASKAIIRNCLVDDVAYTAFEAGGDTVIVQNNIIIDCQMGESLHLSGDQDVAVFQNNLVYDRSPGVASCGGCPTVINSTFDNFRRDYYNPAIYVWEPADWAYSNNSISRMNSAFYFLDNDSWTIPASYFNLWDVDDLGLADNYPFYWDTVGIQWAFPMYAGEEDYHLQEFSPLIDAGDPAIFDVDGSRSDIGVYGGPGGSSYEYVDLAPLVPDSLSAVVIADTIFISWRYNYETDFSRYQVHRETYSGFEPSIFNLIAEPDTSYYEDGDLTPGHNYYYRIAAVDNQDNLSDYSEELEVITTGIEGGWGAEMPTVTAIESNYPNPFNSQTTIIYTVANLGPLPARINIDICDIMGRKVRTLVDERKEVGIHRITWDGRNDAGSDCPSGVYFARISQWGVDYLDRHQKLVLLR